MKKLFLLVAVILMVAFLLGSSPASAFISIDVSPPPPTKVKSCDNIDIMWSFNRTAEAQDYYYIIIHELNNPEREYENKDFLILQGQKEIRNRLPWHISENLPDGKYLAIVKYRTKQAQEPFWVGQVVGNLAINKFYDSNRNGVQDIGELGLAGWEFTVEYKDDPTVEPFVMRTKSDGKCTHDNLAVGNYSVTEEKRRCWTATTATTQQIRVKEKETTLAYFGNYENGTLKITKYNDTNKNSEIDYADKKLPGWEFQVTYPDGKTSNYITDGNGEIKIDVPVGTYTVKEQLKRDGWIAITPIKQTKNVKQCEETPVEFLNAVSQRPVILIQKFNDTNRNRVLDDSDKRAPGWEFKVTDPDGKTTTHFTNDTGEIEIEIPRKYEGKDYTIEEVLKLGCWKPVLPIRQTAKGESKTVQFLNIYEPTVLLIQKFNDTNRNRILDDTEKLSGWEFQVTYPDGKTANYITDSKGEIEIKVPPGSYTVKEILKRNWTAITPIIQNKNVAECITTPVIFHNLFNRRSLRITKYYDHNMNGERDSGEEGIGNWEFEIKYPDGSVERVITDSDGIYERYDPPTGKCTITEHRREDSCWKKSTPMVRDVEITSDRGAEVEFGNYEVGTLTIYKFNDTDHNGVWDAGEVPLPNWGFKVKGLNGVVDITRYTDENGGSTVELPANLRYSVSETIPVGWRNSTPHTQSVYINPCEDTPAIFGNYNYSEIIIRKFNDTNKDGIREDDEEWLVGWDFWIYGPNVNEIFTTDKNGMARYKDAIPGQYRIDELVGDEQREEGWRNTTLRIREEVNVTEGQKVELYFGNYIYCPCENIYMPSELAPWWHNNSDENLVVSKYVDPRIVHCDNPNLNEGEIINVTLRVSAFAGMPPTDLVIAVDTSGSLFECSSGRTVLEAISEGITEYIANNKAKFGENVRIGLVSWDEDIDEIVNLTTDYSNVTAACKRLSINAEEDTLYPVGLNGSMEVFSRSPRENVTKMIVFITDARGTTDGLSNYSRLPDTSGYIIHAITVCTEGDSDNFKMLVNFTSQHSGFVRRVSESSDKLAKELTTLTVSSIERRILNNVTVIETLPKYLRVLNWTYRISPTSPEHINRDGIDWSTETIVWDIGELSSDKCWENTFQAIFCCRMPADETHPVGVPKKTSEVTYTDPTNSSITKHMLIPEGGIWIQPRPWWERVPVGLWALLGAMAIAIIALAILYRFRRTPKQET